MKSISTRFFSQQAAAPLLAQTSPLNSELDVKNNQAGPLAQALLGKLYVLVSSNQTKEMAMILPFLPLLQTHVLAQSEEDIANSLRSVREFIDSIIGREPCWNGCDERE